MIIGVFWLLNDSEAQFLCLEISVYLKILSTSQNKEKCPDLNHDLQTSYRKHYFTDFVKNKWAQFFLISDLMEAARGQKHSSDTENGMKESFYWKKFLMKIA